MNTNIHECVKGMKNEWIARIKKEIRVHSCSFVARFLEF